MPSALVNKVKEKCDLTKDKAESLWNRAKDKAKEQGHEEEWDYITEIFKHLVGKDCMKIMGWEVKESHIMSLVHKYLNEDGEK